MKAKKTKKSAKRLRGKKLSATKTLRYFPPNPC
jgi:hypothetical protein